MTRSIIALTYLLLGGNMLALPRMARKNILFGVPLAETVREGPLARRSLLLFRLAVMAAILAMLCVLFVSPFEALPLVAPAGSVVILLVGSGFFVWQSRKFTSAAIQPLRAADVDLSNEPERLPWFASFSAAPLAFLVGTGVFLHARWNWIPPTFPVHWGFNGPDRWSERTAHGVYGPILFGMVLCAWLFVFALAGWFGARRSHFRRVMFAAMIACECMTALFFSAISLGPLVRLSPLVFVLAVCAFVAGLLIVTGRAIAEPRDPPEPTPNQCWKAAGMLYFNSQDAAIFVEKRVGFGYALNFGNPWSWILAVGFGLSLTFSIRTWL